MAEPTPISEDDWHAIEIVSENAPAELARHMDCLTAQLSAVKNPMQIFWHALSCAEQGKIAGA